MNNGNRNSDMSELIAIANRRREELKRAQAEQIQQRPQPQPQTQQRPPQQQYQPRPQSQQIPSQSQQRRPARQGMPSQLKPQAQENPNTKLADKQNQKAILEKERAEAAARKKREEAVLRARAEEERRRKEEAARVERDKRAAEMRIKRREKNEEIINKLSSIRENYRGTFKNALGYFVIFICVLLIICTVSATIFLFSILNYGEKAETPASVTFSTCGNSRKYDYSEIVRDGIYYLDFKSLANLCNLSVSGDSELIIYSTKNGEQIRFTPPSRSVTVNGHQITAEGEIISDGDHIWIPLSLIRDYFTGLDITIDSGIKEETGDPYLSITVSRTVEDNVFTDISFTLKYNSVLSGISNESLPEEPVTLPVGAPTYEYAADLAYYLRYMCTEDFDKYMVLINPSNPKDATYIPEDLISVPNPRYDNGSSLCRDASMSLEALFLEMHTLGFRDMKVSVAYRTYEQQEYQFDVYTYNERYYYRSHYETEGKWFSDEAYAVLGKAYLEEKYISQGKTSLSADDAKRVAMSYSAYPGTSDHQTGLAFDLYLSGWSGGKFAETDEYKWLCDNAHKFGFIFRYPKEKENITGYSFEPYHLRFVGQYHAALIKETGLSLEEYIAKYID